jgi:redox-sensitive bicupin YhaK (pirin superfamily)
MQRDMIEIRRNLDRGMAELDWLHSRHSFSFGSYHDSRHMGVSALRVINDDRVEPGGGFATHSHQDMEIISYVKQGTIEHRDSMGNVEQVSAGEFQLMSAGTGVTHSEYNPSSTEALEFLQIWITPDRKAVNPGYQQKRFDTSVPLALVASADGAGNSLRIHQDSRLYRLLGGHPGPDPIALAPGRVAYVHVVRGTITANGQELVAGDGATVRGEDALTLSADSDAEALIFDLP